MWPNTRRGRPRARVQDPTQSNPILSHSISTEHTLDPIHDGSTSDLGIQKNVRGRTRLEKLWNNDENSSKRVVLANSRGQPVGDGARELGQFLGTMVRRPRFFSFQYMDWRHVPQEDKEKVWQRVQDVFDIECTLKEWVLLSFNKKWKDFKCQLKRTHYSSFKGDKVGAKGNRPVELEKVEWNWLVDYWESDAGKMREEKSIINRGKQNMPHASGTKSFARRFYEESIRNDGVEPSRLDMFYKLHKKKMGHLLMPLLQNEAQLNTLVSQLPEESQSSNMLKDKIFSQVMGEDNRGCCKMYGLGASAKDFHGPNPTRRQLMETCERLESQNRHLESQNSLMEKDISDLKSKVDILIQVASRQSGVESGAAAILSTISKKGPGTSHSQNNDVGSSHPEEDDEDHLVSTDIMSRN
ncbi:putative transposase Ptta/En/Spm plant protein [Dioscorea alata]|uniref:Transposase Ptta/En/Spm plant protein n=1 Tax=Dioscorea alata TaxID=55571 RepID=A0ACB7UHU5_DIOAL|nr:putative transposase Ptta/En/Spm plant protein [Dioscorea alata]